MRIACALTLAGAHKNPSNAMATMRSVAKAALLFRRTSIGYQSVERNLSEHAA
jgi:hypothetical protein